jgi:hypothetical protein
MRFTDNPPPTSAHGQNSTVAILTTSSIFRTFAYKGDTPETAVTTATDGSPIWSTGRLESTLAQGFIVKVVSTRPRLGAHDCWWLDLLDMAGPLTGKYILDEYLAADLSRSTLESLGVFLGEPAGPSMTDEDRSDAVNFGWRRLFLHLDQPWPHDEVTLRPRHWTAARHFLGERGFTLAGQSRSTTNA